ncbi:MAG: hypothetical protein A3K46_07105 [Chloroflexi bacterium RBG_13_60_9]|nr:MAG: hypothetical protein A3K46_07105 [Chloroflexi bacterium RBG_13_60_9]
MKVNRFTAFLIGIIFLSIACNINGIAAGTDLSGTITAQAETLKSLELSAGKDGSTPAENTPAQPPTVTDTLPPPPSSTPTVTQTPPPTNTQTKDPPSEPQWITIYTVTEECGQIWDDGEWSDFPGVGDERDNRIAQALLSFDISIIPADATILNLQFQLKRGSMSNNPFDDAFLAAFVDDYGSPADALFADFLLFQQDKLFAGWSWEDLKAGKPITWDRTVELLQERLGTMRLQLRLFFAYELHPGNTYEEWGSDNNLSDYLVINSYKTLMNVEYVGG